MDKITQSHRMLIEAIINDYHTTRLDSDYVPHILSKVRTQDAFTRFERDILSHTPQSVEPVATDVAALVEAAKEARSGLCAYTGGDDGACSETIGRIDAALAPFKGQGDA